MTTLALGTHDLGCRCYPHVSEDEAALMIRMAVAADRARIRAAVEELFGQPHPMCAIEDEPTRRDVVSRKAVLALLETHP